MSIPTPHIAAKYGEIAKTVLMPGDPLRSKFVAENFFDDPVLVNNIRGIQGYTGKYKNIPVTVMASGMGIPSIGIYSWELYSYYGVSNIIRIGSAGAISDDLKLKDIVCAVGASTDSNFVHQFKLPGTFAPTADFDLLMAAAECAKERNIKITAGNILSADNFYSDGSDNHDPWKKMGVLAVEMEAAGLYMNAARTGKRALAICTISDHIYTGEALSAEDRQDTFTQMMELALEIAVKAENL